MAEMFLLLKYSERLFHICPRGGEGVKARPGPHRLVVDNHGAGAAGQRREAVGLVAHGERREVGGVVIGIVGSLDGFGQVKHQALARPGDGVHALEQEYVGQIARGGQRGNLGLVLGVGQYVLVQGDIRMRFSPSSQHGAETVGAAIAFGLFGSGEVHDFKLALVGQLVGSHGGRGECQAKAQQASEQSEPEK